MEAPLPLRVHRNSSSSVFDWKPSPIVALAKTSVDDSQVAAAREDGSLELWAVSPSSTTWHCQLTIQGDSDSRVSSLVWCPPTGSSPSSSSSSGRLLSSSIDGSISEWDLFDLNHKTVLDSIGVSIWKMAVEPIEGTHKSTPNDPHRAANGYASMESADSDDDEASEIDDVNSVELHVQPILKNQRLAVACDDGCLRLYVVPDSGGLTYNRSFLRTNGRALSVVWSLDAKLIFSGSSDGFIRCWDANLAHEIYRITVGHGGFGNGPELCVWSLLFLRSGTLVSADSSGSVQFWESQHGTMLQTHSLHKGDVYALAASPSHNRVFSAGSDGQVILYKFSSDASRSGNDKASAKRIKKWVYVGYVRAHTHDIRALTVAMPINRDLTPLEKISTKVRHRKKPVVSSYHKWAHSGNPMLISAGDDTKLFAYSVKEFTKFDPHDICPAPQRVPMQLVLNTTFGGGSLILVQCFSLLVILRINVKSSALPGRGYGGSNTTQLAASVKSKAERKILCSAISFSGVFFAFSDNVSPRLFELSFDMGKSVFCVHRRTLPRKLPYAHSMVFTNDSSRLIIAGHDKKIYVVDVDSAELLHTFTPCREMNNNNQAPIEPPITKLFTSSNGQWLAAINCFGYIYVFNLKMQRQHWFISRLDGASVAAGGFPPSNSNMLIITTASNQVWAFDVESKQLAEWTKNKIFALPREFQEFPSEVIGMSFPPSTSSTSVTIYSARSMCSIDYGLEDKELKDNASYLANGSDLCLNNKKELKRKYKDIDIVLPPEHKQSEFKNPILFVGHLSENSVFVMEKPWREVIETFDAPVHKHVFGT